MENRSTGRCRFFGGKDGVCEPCRRGDIVEIQAVEAAELLLFDLA
jgi:hypothetical protein